MDFSQCDMLSRGLVKKLTDVKVTATLDPISGRTHITIITKMMLSNTDPAGKLMIEFLRKVTK